MADEAEETSDLWQNFVVTSMCARMYGRRSARNQVQKALQEVRDGY